jgi:hypothetical protein
MKKIKMEKNKREEMESAICKAVDISIWATGIVWTTKLVREDTMSVDRGLQELRKLEEQVPPALPPDSAGSAVITALLKLIEDYLRRVKRETFHKEDII